MEQEPEYPDKNNRYKTTLRQQVHKDHVAGLTNAEIAEKHNLSEGLVRRTLALGG